MVGFNKATNWVLLTVAAAIISALVGGVSGSIATIVWTGYEETRRTEFYSIGEDTGIAFPGKMFDLAREEGNQISFIPSELQGVAVCEYYFNKGRSWWDLVLDYLKEYDNCFIVRRLNDKSIEVSEDRRPSSLLIYNTESKTYWCKCPSHVTGLEK